MRQIFLFSVIDTYAAQFAIGQLLDMDRQSNEEITIFINSPGGSVISMFAIVDAMKMVKSPIRTVVMGIAASAAAVIASCGDKRFITQNAEVMIHEASSFAMGTATEMAEYMAKVNDYNTRLMSILSDNTGKTLDELKFMTNKTDKYFTPKEAVAFGLCDKVIQDNEAQLLKLSERINVEGSEFKYVDGKPEVELLCEGKFVHPVYGEVLITEAILNQIKTNFDGKVRGIDLSIDYTHDNEKGENPAACWIKSLEVRQGGKGKVLVANVEFTPKGQKLVSEKEYKYASADFSIDYLNERGKHFPYVLRGGTLTNRPFIKELNPIKLSEYQHQTKEKIKMEKEQLIIALKEAGVDVTAALVERDSLKAQVTDLQNQIRELGKIPAQKDGEINALQTKVTELNKQLTDGEKEAAWNALLDLGKVIPAQKDKILAKFENAAELNEFYKDAPVIVKLKAAGSNSEGVSDELTEAEQALVTNGTYTKEQIINNRSSKKSTAKKS